VEKNPSGPEIVESYRDFKPPRNFKRNIQMLLRYVPSEYLIGLKSIVLTNRAALTRDQRRQKVWTRKRQIRLIEASGSYRRETRSSPAVVWIYVDTLVEHQRWMIRAPFLQYVVPAEVLYHEIGHHIHAAHRPVHEGKENVAEEWSGKLGVRFVRLHYWYAWPVIRSIAILTKPFLKHWKAGRRK